MARIRDIQRTAAFAWSPGAAPFIATGTQAGAVSADFSDNTVLELWDLDLESAQSGGEFSPVASIETDSKCVSHQKILGLVENIPNGIIGSTTLLGGEYLPTNPGGSSLEL